MSFTKNPSGKALEALQKLPRISLKNLRPEPGSKKAVGWNSFRLLGYFSIHANVASRIQTGGSEFVRCTKVLCGGVFVWQQKRRGRGQHGGNRSGRGHKGERQRGNRPRLGFEGGQTPFYLIIPKYGFNTGHRYKLLTVFFIYQTVLWMFGRDKWCCFMQWQKYLNEIARTRV